MRNNKTQAFIFMLALLVVAVSNTAYGEARAVLSEVMAHPAAGSDDEYIEIVNTGTEALDLAECWLASGNGRRQKLIPYIGAYAHGSAGTLLLPSGVALVTTPRYSGSYSAFIQKNTGAGGRLIHLSIEGTRFLSYGLNNGAGIVLLLDDGGRTLDALSWSGDAGEGASWERENPFIQSSSLVRRFGGTPGLAASLMQADDIRSGRARLLSRVVRRGEEGRLILTLRAGDRARVLLKSRSGRELAVVQQRVEGAGRHEVPIILRRSAGGELTSGSYLVHVRITKANGERSNETLLIQIAPRMR